jgi:hypothetical protein
MLRDIHRCNQCGYRVHCPCAINNNDGLICYLCYYGEKPAAESPSKKTSTYKTIATTTNPSKGTVSVHSSGVPKPRKTPNNSSYKTPSTTKKKKSSFSITKAVDTPSRSITSTKSSSPLAEALSKKKYSVWYTDGLNGPEDKNHSQELLIQWLEKGTDWGDNYRYYLRSRRALVARQILDWLNPQVTSEPRKEKDIINKINDLKNLWVKNHAAINSTGEGMPESYPGGYEKYIDDHYPLYRRLTKLFGRNASAVAPATNEMCEAMLTGKIEEDKVSDDETEDSLYKQNDNGNDDDDNYVAGFIQNDLNNIPINNNRIAVGNNHIDNNNNIGLSASKSTVGTTATTTAPKQRKPYQKVNTTSKINHKQVSCQLCSLV